jgi:hypothetical protein
MPQAAGPIRVYTESVPSRVFVGAIDRPGWCRSGRDEEGALEALVAYAPRYATVVARRRPAFRPPSDVGGLRVVERLEGDATTRFGAPAMAPSSDADPIDGKELRRLSRLMGDCWAALDRAADAARGKELATGPRGGGRALDAIVAHVRDAQGAYIRKLASTPPAPTGDAARDAEGLRASVVAALEHAAVDGIPERGPRGGAYWEPRYFVRRSAWHVLDHAWEIEDRMP